ncbi:putative citrate lyase beta subunit [Streptomyces sp. NBRC 110611]|uniref:HpcH/HpaI aldolase/citrate lyase family protein n=1 Tax=Streptomyces sp. NBRC 110611 TaxID=1621259 RepID=UPI0008570246|nr:CoA ester lyase [Streptomyces sp. NBRC 110611]GAU68316.1 putative citrate lyase beta subunit [Streptomyces sp. NBRC 110611]
MTVRPPRETGTFREAPARTPLTWLYVPGDRPEVVARALGCGADVVVIDLEDAVAPDRKARALRATAELLGDPAPGPAPVHVRVNALDGPLAETEIRTLAALPGLAGLRLPKVRGPADVHRAVAWATTDRVPDRAMADRGVGGTTADRGVGGTTADRGVGRVSPALYALLESALGVEHAFAIAVAHPALHGIALGETDLCAELGVRDDAGLAWPRSRTVVAARAAGLAPPPQSVYPDVRDLDGLARSCAQGRALGFLGRVAIHPRQLPVIEAAHLPSPEEVAAAEQVVRAAAEGGGARALPDGRFVDAAVVAGARRVLSLAARRPG